MRPATNPTMTDQIKWSMNVLHITRASSGIGPVSCMWPGSAPTLGTERRHVPSYRPRPAVVKGLLDGVFASIIASSEGAHEEANVRSPRDPGSRPAGDRRVHDDDRAGRRRCPAQPAPAGL